MESSASVAFAASLPTRSRWIVTVFSGSLYRDIDGKRRTTDDLRAEPVLMEAVPPRESA